MFIEVHRQPQFTCQTGTVADGSLIPSVALLVRPRGRDCSGFLEIRSHIQFPLQENQFQETSVVFLYVLLTFIIMSKDLRIGIPIHCQTRVARKQHHNMEAIAVT